MPNYQDFLKMARERQGKRKTSTGGVLFTRHAEYKMKQYGLSVQRVRSVMRNPKRREEGIAKDTIAVMQPVSTRHKDGKETWSQEIWVMFVQTKNAKRKMQNEALKSHDDFGSSRHPSSVACSLRVISAWRYPGVSPTGNPIPEEILREIEEGSMLEEEGIIW